MITQDLQRISKLLEENLAPIKEELSSHGKMLESQKEMLKNHDKLLQDITKTVNGHTKSLRSLKKDKSIILD